MKVMTTVTLGVVLTLCFVHMAIAADAAAPAETQTTPAATTSSSTSVDLRELIFAVGRRSRIRIVIDPRVNAAVDTGGIAARDVTYPILLSILHVHGFAAISEGDIVMVVVEANVRSMAPPLVSPDNIKGEDADIVTTIVPLNSTNATNLVSVLRPMVAQYGYITAVPGKNALLLTDRVLNVKRMVTIIREAEKLPTQEAR